MTCGQADTIWDEGEIYFAADELRGFFPTLTFTRVSHCGGIDSGPVNRVFCGGVNRMSSPYVHYRMDSLSELRRGLSWPISRLDWRADLAMIRRFYARFGKAVDPDEFEPYVGSPLAVIQAGDILSLAIPLSFRAGETEIGGVATVPDRQNEGCCKALIAELSYRILEEGKAVTLTTKKENLPMQRAAEGIGMKRCAENT